MTAIIICYWCISTPKILPSAILAPIMSWPILIIWKGRVKRYRWTPIIVIYYVLDDSLRRGQRVHDFESPTHSYIVRVLLEPAIHTCRKKKLKKPIAAYYNTTNLLIYIYCAQISVPLFFCFFFFTIMRVYNNDDDNLLEIRVPIIYIFIIYTRFRVFVSCIVYDGIIRAYSAVNSRG